MPSLPAEIQRSVLSMAMDSVLLDLERARMEREDFRQGNAIVYCCYTATNVWPYTWRQNAMIQADNVDDATQALSNVRGELRDMDGRVPMNLADNYTQMLLDVTAVLGSDEESDATSPRA